MTRIDEFEMAVIIEQTKEHRSIAAHLGMLAKKAVHVIENARWIGAERHAGKRALQHGGQNGGTESFAGNVGNDKRRAPIAYAKNVEIVASDREARKIHTGHAEVRRIRKIARQQRLLDVARDVDFLFESLALAFALDQTRVVENAGGVGGQRIQDLPVELGESRGALGIQVKNA